MNQDFHRRYASLILVCAALCAPVVLYGVIKVHTRSDNSVAQWLPKDYETTRFYSRFTDLFGSDEKVLVSWIGCTLDDPRLESFARLVEGTGELPEQEHLASIVQEVMTGQRTLAELRAPPLQIDRQRAVRRLQGSLIGPDEQTTCALITLGEATTDEREQAVMAIRDIAVTHCGVDADDLRMTGDAVLSVGIDVESEQAIDRWVLLSGLVALSMSWLCLRSVKLALLVFLVSQYCQMVSEAVIYYSGGSMNLLVELAPVLVYVLSLSACVHLVNYYRAAVASCGAEQAPQAALQAGWWPCLLASVTTALGLISLCVSHLPPVKSFGLYSSVGILLGFVVFVLLLPAATAKFPVVPRAGAKPRPENPLSPWLIGMARLVIRYRAAVLAASLTAFILFAIGVTKLNTSVEPIRFLPQESRWVTDTYWYRDNLGPMASVEIVIEFEKDVKVAFGDRIRLMDEIQRSVTQLENVDGTLSAATFAPTLPPRPDQVTGLRQTIRRSGINKILLNNRDAFVQQRYVADDAGREIWRVTARVAEFRDLVYDDFIGQLRERINPLLDRAEIPASRRRLEFTGTVPLIFAAQRELLDALLLSFAVAVSSIAIVMPLVLRSLPAGIVSMIPNVFPALATFGIMGWIGSVVDVGAMMTASIGLGIAVDDTLHFLTWFRRAIGDGATQKEAIEAAYRKCAHAMLHTTLIAGLSLFVFYFSSFQPVSQFGLLLFTLLLTALIGDLVLLPALLATPLGRCFTRTLNRHEVPR
jgi:predicted RND superfamily exporter protein